MRKESSSFGGKELKKGESVVVAVLDVEPYQDARIRNNISICKQVFAHLLHQCERDYKLTGILPDSNELCKRITEAKKDFSHWCAADSRSLQHIAKRVTYHIYDFSSGRVHTVWFPTDRTKLSYVTDQEVLRKYGKWEIYATGRLSLPKIGRCKVKNKIETCTALKSAGRIMAALIEWSEAHGCWIAKMKCTTAPLPSKSNKKHDAYICVATDKSCRRYTEMGWGEGVRAECHVVASSKSEAIKRVRELHPAYRHCEIHVFEAGDDEYRREKIREAREHYKYRSKAVVTFEARNNLVGLIKMKLQHIIDSVWADLNYRRQRFTNFMEEVCAAPDKTFPNADFLSLEEYEQRYVLA